MQRGGGPNTNQRAVYSRRKRLHCLACRCSTTSEDLIFYAYDPDVERIHDITLHKQNAMNLIRRESVSITGLSFYVYGHSAYMLRLWLQTVFSQACTSPERLHFNTGMGCVCKAVEWSYKDLKQRSVARTTKRC